MREISLEFKGLKNGLYAICRGIGSFEEFLETMEEKLSNAGDFFSGAYLAGVYGLTLDQIEEDILEEILESKYGIKVKRPLSGKETPSQSDTAGDMPTRFVHSTLRSGQKVSYGGNVVILGDINAGAEVEAGGCIVVMGSLRGNAKAGAPDNHEASISAISLQPTRLKIGKIAARWPDQKRHAGQPETAYIQKGKMYVKPIFDIR